MRDNLVIRKHDLGWAVHRTGFFTKPTDPPIFLAALSGEDDYMPKQVVPGRAVYATKAEAKACIRHLTECSE